MLIWINVNFEKSFPHEAVSRKESALRALSKMYTLFDSREYFMANCQEIALALLVIIRNPERNIPGNNRKNFVASPN
jgi:hypothetical protein